MEKRYFITYLFSILIGLKCFPQPSLINKSDIGLSFKELKILGDSVLASFYLINKSKDTIIFPKTYVNFELAFVDSEIYRAKIISDKVLYPYFNYKSKKQKRKILSLNCRPLLNKNDYCWLAKGDSILLSIDILEMGYAGFQKNRQYSVRLKINVSNQIKCFCSKIWSGNVISNFFIIRM